MNPLSIAASLSLTVLLVACGKQEAPTPAVVPSVEELAADPVRLKALRQRCKTDRPTMDDVLCNRVAEATSRRFLGDGKVPYTPPKEPPKF